MALSATTAFRNNTSITTVSLPVVEAIGNQNFFNLASLVTVDIQGHCVIGNGNFQGFDAANRNTLLSVIAPNAISVGQDFCRDQFSLEIIDLRSAISTGSIFAYKNFSLLQLRLDSMENLGPTQQRDSNFEQINPLAQITVPLALQTSNNGSEEGDIAYARGLGCTINYI